MHPVRNSKQGLFKSLKEQSDGKKQVINRIRKIQGVPSLEEQEEERLREYRPPYRLPEYRAVRIPRRAYKSEFSGLHSGSFHSLFDGRLPSIDEDLILHPQQSELISEEIFIPPSYFNKHQDERIGEWVSCYLADFLSPSVEESTNRKSKHKLDKEY